MIDQPSVAATIMRLLDRRGRGKTICPSEVARDIAAATDDEWRPHMEAVHAAVDALAAQGSIALSWKGKPLAERRGAYRIAQPAAADPRATE